jgi:hypothetical protein
MKKRKKTFKRILALFFILIAGLIVLLILNFKLWQYFSKKEVVMVNIPDECSLMFENILHNIKDTASCENSCRARCYTLEKDYYNSEFAGKDKACNECKCYCK